MRFIDAELTQGSVSAQMVQTLHGVNKEAEEMMRYYNPSSFLAGVRFGMELASKIIHNAPTVEAKPEWIPCSEGLPRNDGEYLVWLRYEGREFTSIEDYKNKDGWDFCTYNPNDRVIAWMPLPKAYNAERGGKND